MASTWNISYDADGVAFGKPHAIHPLCTNLTWLWFSDSLYCSAWILAKKSKYLYKSLFHGLSYNLEIWHLFCFGISASLYVRVPQQHTASPASFFQLH